MSLAICKFTTNEQVNCCWTHTILSFVECFYNTYYGNAYCSDKWNEKRTHNFTDRWTVCKSLSLSLRQTDTSNKRFSQCLISNSIIFIFKRKRVPSTRLFADPPSGDECTDGAPDLGPTDGTLSNGRGTQDTATQVTAGQEDNAHLRVQTDLTRLLFPEQAVLLSQVYK